MSQIESFKSGFSASFGQLIAEQTGLAIRPSAQAALYQKIFQRMQVLQLASPEYYQLMNSKTSESDREWQHLITLLTNPESYFFRDKEQFSLLKNSILPELIQRNRSTQTLRICSAGCSTGEEAYSLAILLTELLPDQEQWNIKILGVDINLEVLQKAKLGLYRSWSFRGVDGRIQQRYFQSRGHEYQIIPSIRQLPQFQLLNLVQPDFSATAVDFKDMDLILCRNVFIYFERSTICAVLDRLYHALNPRGYLLTGHAEVYDQDLENFQVKVFPESIIYQHPNDPIAVQE
ncbi:CheR family methyltransferase [Egbenema bharatensis]|uniref:CheR family methyltransferase n=1 Tax=Egbenema bharatensis TaxID=3463334 RepID=UPI003A87CC10